MSNEETPIALLDLEVESGPTTTISLAGDLDPATAPQLDAAIKDAIATDGLERVVLDLSKLTFIDSSGLRVFVTARQALSALDIELTLRSPSVTARRLLDITGLGEILSVE